VDFIALQMNVEEI